MTATVSMTAITKEYHNGNDSEEHHYHQYLVEQHMEYYPFLESKAKEQHAYWNWRHSRPDHDHDGR